MPARRAPANHFIDADISIDDGDWSWLKNAEESVRRAVHSVPRSCASNLGVASVAISLSSDVIIRDLNCRYRGKNKATNVLSFPALAGSAEGFLGDIIIAVETVVREAEESGVPGEHHLQHLVVHGVLHLLGFDHENDRDAERMEAVEIEILEKMGIENPYTEPLEGGTKQSGTRRPDKAIR